MRIFFGGPLTELKDKEGTKRFYTHMAEVAQKNNIECFWAFLHGTDPVKNPDVSASRVYTADLGQLTKSDVMINYIGEPTTGTGQEIEYARAHGIPVYLLYEKGKKISRMVKGSPNIKGSIIFTTQEEALTQLDELIDGLKLRYEQRGTLKEDFSIPEI